MSELASSHLKHFRIFSPLSERPSPFVPPSEWLFPTVSLSYLSTATLFPHFSVSLFDQLVNLRVQTDIEDKLAVIL